MRNKKLIPFEVIEKAVGKLPAQDRCAGGGTGCCRGRCEEGVALLIERFECLFPEGAGGDVRRIHRRRQCLYALRR